MAAGLKMSTSVVVPLTLREDLVLGLTVFLADLELRDLDFLVGFVENKWFNHSSVNMKNVDTLYIVLYFTIAKDSVLLPVGSDSLFHHMIKKLVGQSA